MSESNHSDLPAVEVKKPQQEQIKAFMQTHSELTGDLNNAPMMRVLMPKNEFADGPGKIKLQRHKTPNLSNLS